LPPFAFCHPEWLHPPFKAIHLYGTSGRIGSFCGKTLDNYTVGAVIIAAIYSVSLELGECSQGKVLHAQNTVFSVIIFCLDGGVLM
jgi:hypothetical protein